MIIVIVTVIVIIIIYELPCGLSVYCIIQTLFGSSAYLLDYKLSDNIYCVTLNRYIVRVHKFVI